MTSPQLTAAKLSSTRRKSQAETIAHRTNAGCQPMRFRLTERGEQVLRQVNPPGLTRSSER